MHKKIKKPQDCDPLKKLREKIEGEMSNYQQNGEFHLEGYTPQRNVKNYSCCPEPYPDITYALVMRRRPMFYVFNLILPCILINLIGRLT